MININSFHETSFCKPPWKPFRNSAEPSNAFTFNDSDLGNPFNISLTLPHYPSWRGDGSTPSSCPEGGHFIYSIYKFYSIYNYRQGQRIVPPCRGSATALTTSLYSTTKITAVNLPRLLVK